MSKLNAIVLILLVTAQLVIKMGVIGYFEVNRDYIASERCINRDRPALHCEGQCFLMQKLKQAEPRQPSGVVALLSNMEIAVFTLPAADEVRSFSDPARQITPFLMSNSGLSFPADIFRPPPASV
ncbi:MAG: hypothetical protein EAZ89_17385 [Bacteroidetes bacterium]|nr:MAG: hypothetical protein EAZ89_17385 [Bacteroidota bacterium]